MGAPTPAVIIEPFGANASDPTNITLPIPVPSQLPGNPGNASFNDGFTPDTMLPVGSGGIPPRGQDMNGILYMLSAYCQALTGGQFWAYNSTWSAANSGYNVGAILSMANGLGFWLNTVASNTANPDTAAANTSGWVPLAAYGKTSIVTTGTISTLTAVEAATPLIVVSGALTSNVQLAFPTWLKSWRIVNNTTGNYTVGCVTTGGSNLVLIPQLQNIPFEISADGAGNLQYGQNIAFGAFTGTMTDGTNTGSIALGYVSNGSFACIYNGGAGVTIASSNGELQISGVPEGITPSVNVLVPVTALVDNSSVNTIQLTGFCEIVNGIMKFGLNKTNLVTNGVASQIFNFTASGNKGLLAGFSMIYPLL